MGLILTFGVGVSMAGRIALDAKLLGETKNVPFDFISDLAIGETISTSVVTCSVYSGTDASPSSVISGSSSNSGTKVTQKITGGTLGVVYELLCTITTSAGQTLELVGILAVVPDVI